MIVIFIAPKFRLPPVDGSAANLRLESLLVIQVHCGPSSQFGNALQESPAGSRTKAQAKASAEAMQHM